LLLRRAGLFVAVLHAPLIEDSLANIAKSLSFSWTPAEDEGDAARHNRYRR
jgi:hypothetical protein